MSVSGAGSFLAPDWQRVFDAAGCAMLVLDAHGRVVHANPAARARFAAPSCGCDRSDPGDDGGFAARGFADPGDATGLRGALDRLLGGAERVDMAWPRGGDTAAGADPAARRWCLSAVRDDGGALRHVVCVAGIDDDRRDAEARGHAAPAGASGRTDDNDRAATAAGARPRGEPPPLESDRLIEQLRQPHALLFAESLDAHVLVDPGDGSIVECNSTALAMLRTTRDRVLGRTVLDISPPIQPDGRPTSQAGRERIDEAMRLDAYRFEWMHRRFDGSEFPVEVTTARCVHQGRVMVLGAWRDLTDRRETEHAARQLAAIAASPEVAIVSARLDGSINGWNIGAERLFGHGRDDAIGRPIETVFAPDGEAARAQRDALARARSGARVERMETVLRRRDGVLIEVVTQMSALKDDGDRPTGLLLVARDISDVKRRDAELRRSNAELEQFAYAASHDLQEPLRMVAGYTELLGTRYESQLDARANHYIHRVAEGARRMQRLVTDLLASSQVVSQGRPLEPIPSHDALRQALESLRARIRATGAMVDIGELPIVCADEVQLAQLFQNLVGNAIKYRSQAPPVVAVRAKRRAADWLFSVRDNGIGFDMRHAERVFQPFQRLPEARGHDGSGIGLALARRIVERHGGAIWVESAPQAGSTFFFTLPVTRSTP